MGPIRREDTVTPHTRPPVDEDADHLLVRTVLCLDGSVEIELICEPLFDYGSTPAEWSLVDGDRPHRRCQRSRRHRPAAKRHPCGHRGRLGPGAARAQAGRAGLLLALLGGGARLPRRRRRSQRADRGDDSLLAGVARPGAASRPPLARADPALGPGDQGPHLHADGRDRGGADHVPARDPWRRAQLGLPLHLDARLDLHPAGAALPQPRLGGRRVHAVRRRSGGQRGRRAADHVRDRRPPRPHRDDARRPLRLCGRAARCGSATAPSTSARTTSSAPCWTRSFCTPAAASDCPRRLWPIVESQAKCATRRLAAARPGHLGGARRAPALRLLEADVLGRARPRRQAGRDPRRPEAGRELAGDRGGDQGGHPRQRPQGRGAAPALRHRRARRLDPARRALRLPARRRRAPSQERPGDRRRPDRGRLRPALPNRGDRRRDVGQGGQLPDLLVLAGLGAGDRRRAAARPRPDGAPAQRRLAARPLRGGVRHRHRPPPRQLPPGLLPPRADRGGGADHPRRAARGDRAERPTT